MQPPTPRLVLLACALATIGHAQTPAHPTTLAGRVRRIIDRPEFAHATFGVEIYDRDTHRNVLTIASSKLFVPGSTTKLLTEGTALALLGADYRFHTSVYRTGPITPDSVVTGDLVLVASGDPDLSGRVRGDSALAFENEDHSYGGSPETRAVPGDPLQVLHELAQQVAAKGIKRITGRVRIDISLFPEGDREGGTGVVISPIVVNDNVIDVTAAPAAAAGGPATLTVSPTTRYLRFVNHVTTGATGSAPTINWETGPADSSGAHTVTATGTVAAGAAPILFSYAVPEPSRFARATFVETLREAGVDVSDAALRDTATGVAPTASRNDWTQVAEHVSPPLSEDVRITLKVSQNLHASMTPYLLGALLAHAHGDSAAQRGFDQERAFLQSARLDLRGAMQSDGAGAQALFTPDFIVHYLLYMAGRLDYPLFLRALPIMGRDGTLADIQVHSNAAGHVFAKTGTFDIGDMLNRNAMVTGKGLAGYITAANGHRLVFAAYANNVAVPATPDAVQNIVGQALGEIAAAAYGGSE
jgi:PBP4 family serine-type D-alanyl-D-alanine carboxypeptidase